MTTPPIGGGRRTPGAGAALSLLLVVAALYLFLGVPLQIAFGEYGLILSQFLFLLLPALLFVRGRKLDLVETLSLRLPTVRQMVGGTLILFGGVQVAWILTWLQSLFVAVPTQYLEAVAVALTADSWGRFLQLILVAALAPAVAEEALFRGVLLSGLRSRLPTLWAVVGVGLIFGAFHLSPQTAFRFLPTAWLGMVLAGVVVASGSLPLAALLHFLNNAAILALTAIPVTRENLADPAATPPLALVPVAFALLFWGARILRGGTRPVDGQRSHAWR